MYQRTQVLLESWQHSALKRLADSEGTSLSNVVRRIVSSYLRPPRRKGRTLSSIAGIGKDKQAAGRDHDRWLYDLVRER
jgi:hypothetical protein